MLDRRHLDRNAGPEARFAILEAPFSRGADLQNRTVMIVVRTFPGESLSGSRYETDNQKGRHWIEQLHGPSPSMRTKRSSADYALAATGRQIEKRDGVRHQCLRAISMVRCDSDLKRPSLLR